MCLISENLFPKTAENDIICYKILIDCGTADNPKYISPYYDAEWKVGVKHHCENHFPNVSYVYHPKRRAVIEAGYFHTFANEEAAKCQAGRIAQDYNTINSGNSVVVFRAVIPKGSIMWDGFTPINNLDSYASKDLMILEEVGRFGGIVFGFRL